MSDPFGAFQLYPEQKLALRIERPRVTAFEIFFLRNPPNRSSGRFGAAAARADVEPAAARRAAGAAHPLDRRRQRRIDPGRLMGIAAGFDKGAHGVSRLGLAQQHPMHAESEDLTELPGIEPDIGGVGAVDRRLDDDGWSAVTRARRPALDETAHVLGQP